MMKILYKYPTRGRWEWFQKTLQTYYDMMSGKNPFQFVVTLNIDDADMFTPEVKEYLNRQLNLVYKYGPHRTKVEAINADMKNLKWDILILVSDDMVPIVENFDDIIVEKMKKYFPDTDGVLHFNDGLFGKDRTITLSIIGRKLYEKFDYIYHPAYKSFFCDNEFTDVVRKLNKVKYFSQVIIQHKWKGGQKADDTYKRNSKLGKDDEHTYNRRKLLDFPNTSFAQ